MHIITITSDFGFGSTYQASLSAAIYSKIKNAQVIYITNNIKNYDILQAAFAVKTNYMHFPPGTWHFICVENNLNYFKQVIVAEYNQHYFICTDNGIFNLLFNDLKNVYTINIDKFNPNIQFIERDIFVDVAAHFFKNGNLSGVAQPGEVKVIRQNIVPPSANNLLFGVIVFVDGYGNAICNITKTEFDNFTQNRAFKIFYSGKNFINKVSSGYIFNDDAEEIVMFNLTGHMQFTVNHGNAMQLLGLKVGSKIMIEIYD